MILQETVNSFCPYCGENIELLIDGSIDEQTYIEDCQVCCRPIVIYAIIGTMGEISIETRTEDD